MKKIIYITMALLFAPLFIADGERLMAQEDIPVIPYAERLRFFQEHGIAWAEATPQQRENYQRKRELEEAKLQLEKESRERQIEQEKWREDLKKEQEERKLEQWRAQREREREAEQRKWERMKEEAERKKERLRMKQERGILR